MQMREPLADFSAPLARTAGSNTSSHHCESWCGRWTARCADLCRRCRRSGPLPCPPGPAPTPRSNAGGERGYPADPDRFAYRRLHLSSFLVDRCLCLPSMRIVSTSARATSFHVVTSSLQASPPRPSASSSAESDAVRTPIPCRCWGKLWGSEDEPSPSSRRRPEASRPEARRSSLLAVCLPHRLPP